MLKKLLAMLAVTLALVGCSTVGTGGMGDASAAAEKLRLLMINPDRAGLEAIVADELSYGHSGGKVDTKASFIADLMSGASDFVTITITDQSVRAAGNAALIRHTLSATTNDGGKPGTVTIKILQVWLQQSGQWKLIARQAVRPPA
jgi:uncharacterized protein YceK